MVSMRSFSVFSLALLAAAACNTKKDEATQSAQSTFGGGGADPHAATLPADKGAGGNMPRSAASAYVGAPYGGGVGGQKPSPGTFGDETAAFVPKLDPNARYATTYRPGGAALAAFDSAVSRGAIPATYKDLVGDFGGRYVPAIDDPGPVAMAFKVDTDRTALGPNGGPLTLRIAMRSSTVAAARAPLSVHLVLDVSGSMRGAAIENAKTAAKALVQKLQADDDFSMVTFSNDASVLVPDAAIGPRRAFVLGKIDGVQADGGTNISSGLDLGYQQARGKAIREDAVKIVMFLSDGHANGGDTNPQSIGKRSADAFQDGIQTSSFGLGQDFDASLMSSIADRGAGGYYYLADSSQIAAALGTELDARLVPAAQAVEIRVRLRPDVTPVKVYGSHVLDGAEAAAVRAQEIAVDNQAATKNGIKQDRKDDAEGGMRFFMPSFSKDDRHAMLIGLQLPKGVGERAVATVEVRYKDRLRKKNITEEMAVRISYAASDADSAKTQSQSVACTMQAFAAGDTILRAAELVDRGDRQGAAGGLFERAQLLKTAATTLNEPRLAEEGARLAKLGEAVNGPSIPDALPLAVMLRGSGYGYLR